MYKTTLLILAMLLPFFASAHDFEVDGIYYNINGNEATVTYQGSYPTESDEYSGDVVIPSTVSYNGTTYRVTAIGQSAFQECRNLTSIEIPNTVTTIGNYSFERCYSLRDIDIPNSVTTIGGAAFYNCTGLTSVSIGNSVTSIYSNTFYKCTSLTSLTIGSSVTSIESAAFSGCNALDTVKCFGLMPPMMTSTTCFSTEAYYRATLFVPRGCKDSYNATNYWYKFAHIDEMMTDDEPGDVNGNGSVTIADVTALIDYLLGGSASSFDAYNADVNGDGGITIKDVTDLIDMLLGSE